MENQRWLLFAKQPVRLTGQPLHTGPWALSCTRVSTPESPHQLPLPLWVGSPPSLSVPACLSAKSCNDTDLKGSRPNCFHPQAPRPLRVCLPPPPSPGLLQPVLGHHRPGLSHCIARDLFKIANIRLCQKFPKLDYLGCFLK